jgi:hypothetical protein
VHHPLKWETFRWPQKVLGTSEERTGNIPGDDLCLRKVTHELEPRFASSNCGN